MKKSEIRALLQNIDKEAAAAVTFNEFLDMASPKVRGGVKGGGGWGIGMSGWGLGGWCVGG